MVLGGMPAAGLGTLSRPTESDLGIQALKYRVHRRLIAEIDANVLQGPGSQGSREEVARVARNLLSAEGGPGIINIREQLVEEIVDEALGLGPLEPLLRDPTVTEIMVNAPDQVYCERAGRLHLTEATFRDNDHIMKIIEKIVSPLGRRIDEGSPMVDARLADGSRVNAVIPPVSINGPSLTIRRFPSTRLQMADLIRFGTLTQQVADFLDACVKLRLNIIVSGGTGSGKTTLLNILSSYVPSDERIVTIENPAELQLPQPHVVTMEARPPSLEGRNEISQGDLVRNALRMRPDRIVVGEVRGGEAFDMLQAMNTGHDGSLSTVHANSPRDALSRIENMVLMAGMDLPSRAIREQISSAIHVVVQQARMRDGSRRITHITEVSGREGETVTTQDIFLFRQKGVDAQGKIVGALQPTGLRPSFAERFEQSGISVPADTFLNPDW